MLFSAFGAITRIAVSEQASGLQVLVQFKEATTASLAMAALNGRPVPAYMVPNHPGDIQMAVSYAARTDLTVQSHGGVCTRTGGLTDRVLRRWVRASSQRVQACTSLQACTSRSTIHSRHWLLQSTSFLAQ